MVSTAPTPPSDNPSPSTPLPSRILNMALVPLVMGGTLSGLMTWINVGFVDGFYWRWLTSFVSALPLMALGFALMSFYGKQVNQRLTSASDLQKKLVLAVLMGLTMELLVSSVVTLRNVGWHEGFASAWIHAFIKSLPIGLAMGLLMGFVVRPWLQRLTANLPTGA